MIQIFILGSSSVYGVGGHQGGWADLVKQTLHQKMYTSDGVGEKYEVYNFGKSGATIDFVFKTFPQLLKDYGRNQKTISIVSVGGNNAKAEHSPDNFVSTLDEYQDQMSELLDLLNSKSDAVIAVGGGYYDEAKTNPKISPLSGSKSYFTNQRKLQFEQALKALCLQKQIPFVEVEITKQKWLDEYIATDGLHPNQKGHQYISDLVLNAIQPFIS